MKPKKRRVPSPVHHKASDKDVVFLRGPDGKRRMVYLGDHDSLEAARRYREILADHLAGKPVATSPKVKVLDSEWPTVAQLSAAFLLRADKLYVDAAGHLSKGLVNFHQPPHRPASVRLPRWIERRRRPDPRGHERQHVRAAG